MRKIEYNPKPLLGYSDEFTWSVDSELSKLNPNMDNYQNTSQYNLYSQMQDSNSTIDNDFHTKINSYIHSNIYYNKDNNSSNNNVKYSFQ